MSLRKTVLQGSVWTVAAAAANKIVTLVGQLALAWLLLPEDFGLAALALSLSSIATLFSAASFKTLLIQRQEDFRNLASEVFWLGLSLHLLAGLLIFLLAPWGALWFGDARVTPLVRIIALSTPLTALPMVYWARLQSDLRFGTVAAIQLGQGVLQTGSAVLLAFSGFGALSFVLPRLWVPLFGLLAARLASGKVALQRPNLASWPTLVTPAIWIALFAFIQSLSDNATNLVLGVLENPTIVGVFFWGYQVAGQAVYLLTINLRQVLFPAFATLKEDQRRLHSALWAPLKAVTAITALLCVLQALLARPLVELLFDDRWLEAVPVIQALSLGLVLSPLGVIASSVLLGTGRFRAITLLTAVQVVLTSSMAAIGAWHGGATQIAIAVAFATLAGHLLIGLLVFRQMQIDGRSLARSLSRAAMSVVPAFAAGSLSAGSLQSSNSLLSIVVTAATTLGAWAVTAPRICPEVSEFAITTIRTLSSPRVDV